MWDNVKLGIAPIGWTNDDLPELGGHIPFEQCVREMAAAGYAGSEVGNKYPRDPKVLRAALEPLGLRIASAWLSVYFTEANREAESLAAFTGHAAFLKQMGAEVIVVCECGNCIQQKKTPIFGEKPVFGDSDWRGLVSGLHEIGRRARDLDMRIVFHHHMGTGVQTREEIDRLMTMTDPELVSLLADTGHITFAGSSALSLVRDHRQRIRHVHLKDLRPQVLSLVKDEHLSFLEAVKLGVFTVPGDGGIDFRPILRTLSDTNYAGWMIVEAEQDPDKAPPFEYAKKAHRYLMANE